MKDYKSIPIFNSNIESIKEVSYDDKNKEYMITSQLQVINFDKVKKEYCKNFSIKSPPKSCDGLYISGDKIFLLEFKNGKVDSFDVGRKIYDSILIFSDLTESRISETRKNVEYILIYNKEKNNSGREDEKNSARNIQQSENYEKLEQSFFKIAKEEMKKFNLERFETYVLKEIHTYTKEEFEKFFIKKYEHSCIQKNN